jgi:IclR family acetate operon transcriptional repressor
MNTPDTDVKSARRVVQIFQLFAELRRPVPLALISKRLELPKSSCLALLKTLESNGYLYRLNEGKDYYPTRRMFNETRIITDNDPLLSSMGPLLRGLRETTGETVYLAKREGHLSHYVEVVESDQTLRFAATVGEKRQLHIGAAGQCLLAAIPDEERSALIDELELTKYSANTITSAAKLKKVLAEGKARGWYLSVGGYQSGVASIGNYVWINAEAYAIVVAGPTERIVENEQAIGRAVAALCKKITQQV